MSIRIGIDEYPAAPQSYDIECAPREDIRELQERRLRAAITHAWDNIPLYRRLWERHGIKPSDISSLDKLSKLPPVNIWDYRESIKQYPPFGDFQGITLNKALRLFTSGGTTGTPRLYMVSKEDWEKEVDISSRLYHQWGLIPGEDILLAFGAGILIGPTVCYDAARRYGLSLISTQGLPLEKWFDFLQQLRPTCLVGTPALHSIIIRGMNTSGMKPSDTSIRVLTSAAEPLIPSRRKEIEDFWGVPVLDFYGCVESGLACGSECPQGKAGIHFPEDALIVEALNPETLEPVKPGEQGELTLTTLYRRCNPIFRYRMGDMCTLATDPCACGRTTVRVGNLLGRADDKIRIKGINVWPTAIDELIGDVPGCTREFALIAEQIGGSDELIIKVEPEPGADAEAIKSALKTKVKTALKLTPIVEVSEPGSVRDLTTDGGKLLKARRSFDRRPTE